MEPISVFLCDDVHAFRALMRYTLEEEGDIRIVGEALRNVAQHAGATTAKVALLYDQDGVVVTVEDDGKGFDVDETFRGAEDRGHFGVVGMRERAEAAGGHLVVRSEPGKGSIVRSSIPYMSESMRLASEANYGRRSTDVVDQTEVTDGTAQPVGFFARLFGR